MNGYEKVIIDNLKKVFEKKDVPEMRFKVLGEDCLVKEEGIFLSEKKEISPVGIIVSLYAQNHLKKEPVFEPFISIREIPGSMPYHGAFHENSERPLVPYVRKIYEKKELILKKLGSPEKSFSEDAGDFFLVLFPLPKIALKYIFYFEDEEFPASVTCLFSNNAIEFLPLDPLADLAEYTGKKIIELLSQPPLPDGRGLKP